MGSSRLRFLVPSLMAVVSGLGVGCGLVAGVDFGAVHLGAEDSSTGADAPSGNDASGGGRGDALAGGDAGGACVPKTCAQLGFACGTQNDGCDNAIQCGSCEGGAACAGGACQCQPRTCQELDAGCGTVDDGCKALNCGACGANQICNAGSCACQPQSCADQKAECGTVPDGCGNQYQCGACEAGTFCGGAGPNLCGAAPCVPKTCGDAGANCGSISNGCGALLACGTCTSPATCGGSGSANVCGCTPTTCAAQGKNCGSIPDGCGNMLACGSCTAPETCAGAGTANVCGCTPTTCAALDDSCGAPSNGCGGALSCGSCTSPDTCGGGGVAGACGCTPHGCDGACGLAISNGCGGVIDCGSCGGGGCFVAGTLVTMADGALVPIERVHSGDAVRSFDPAGGVVTTAHVTAALKHEAGTYPDGIVRVNGSLLATGNHPFFANGGRVRADQLAVGASIVTLGPAGKPQTDQVRSVESRPAGVPVFDLRVDGPGTFFAGGIVVLLKD